MVNLTEDYLNHLLALGRAASTVYRRKLHIGRFFDFCNKEPQRVITDDIRRFQTSIADKTYGEQQRHLIALRDFFGYLLKNAQILTNAVTPIAFPRVPKSLPARVLTAKEAETLFLLAGSLRDRAIMELFYATGIRRSELTNLLLEDVNSESALITVRETKGAKDRVVPVSERALRHVEKYLYKERPESEFKNVFLEGDGNPINPEVLSTRINSYFKRMGYESGSCHVFRHTFATLMLEGGADLRQIQEMLGHKHLQTTQVYTRVSIQRLSDVHAKTHPLANA
jgi:integrase/recombinase XerD